MIEAVVYEDGTAAGILELRELFHERFEDMNRQLDSLEQYLAADGPGG